MKSTILLFGIFLLNTVLLKGQSFQLTKDKLEAVMVSMSLEKIMGKNAVKVIKEEGVHIPD